MKKTISLFILICLSFTLISCAQNNFNFNEEGSEVDFLGSTFTVYSESEWLSEKRKRGESASTDRFLDRIEQIENDYNVKFRNEHDNLQGKILALTLNGGGGCDMVYCGNDSLFNFYNLGILTPFEEIGVKDHNAEKFGIPSLLFEGTFGGTQYGIVNYLGDSVPALSGLIAINMKLLSEFEMDDPHEYIEKGEWNWANFRVVLAQGTFDDGEIKHVGMLTDAQGGGMRSFFPAIVANGGFIVKEIDGVYKSGLTESNAIEAMEFMTQLVQDGLMQVAGGTAWDICAEGKTWPMMNEGKLWWSSEEIDYSMVRFPYGPSGNKDIVATYSTNRNYYAFTMLSSFDNDAIGTIIDDFMEPLDVSLYPEGWKDYAIENLFYSDTDYETYMIGLETMNYYPMGILFGTTPWSQAGEVETALNNILAGRGTAQAEMDSVSALLQEAINKSINNMK